MSAFFNPKAPEPKKHEQTKLAWTAAQQQKPTARNNNFIFNANSTNKQQNFSAYAASNSNSRPNTPAVVPAAQFLKSSAAASPSSRNSSGTASLYQAQPRKSASSNTTKSTKQPGNIYGHLQKLDHSNMGKLDHFSPLFSSQAHPQRLQIENGPITVTPKSLSQKPKTMFEQSPPADPSSSKSMAVNKGNYKNPSHLNTPKSSNNSFDNDDEYSEADVFLDNVQSPDHYDQRKPSNAFDQNIITEYNQPNINHHHNPITNSQLVNNSAYSNVELDMNSNKNASMSNYSPNRPITSSYQQGVQSSPPVTQNQQSSQPYHRQQPDTQHRQHTDIQNQQQPCLSQRQQEDHYSNPRQRNYSIEEMRVMGDHRESSPFLNPEMFADDSTFSQTMVQMIDGMKKKNQTRDLRLKEVEAKLLESQTEQKNQLETIEKLEECGAIFVTELEVEKTRLSLNDARIEKMKKQFALQKSTLLKLRRMINEIKETKGFIEERIEKSRIVHDTLTKEKQSLEDKIEQKNNDFSELNAKHIKETAELNKHNELLLHQVEESNVESTNLRSKIEAHKDTIRELIIKAEVSKSEHASAIKDLNYTIASLNEQINSNKTQQDLHTSNLQEKIILLENYVQEKEDRYTAAVQSLNEMTQARDELAAGLRDANAAIVEFEEGQEKHKCDMGRLEENVNVLEEEKERLSSRITQLETENGIMQQDILDRTFQSEADTARISELEQRCRNLSDQIEQLNVLSSDLTEQVAQKTLQLQNLSDDAALQTNEMEAKFKNMYDAATKKYNDYVETTNAEKEESHTLETELKSKIESYVSQSETLTISINEKSVIIETLTKNLELSVAKVKSLETDLAKSLIDAVEFNTLNSNSFELEKKVEELGMELNVVRKKSENYSIEIATKKRRIEELEGQLLSKDAQCTDLVSALKMKDGMIDSIKTSLECDSKSYKKQIEEKDNALAKMQLELNEANDKINNPLSHYGSTTYSKKSPVAPFSSIAEAEEIEEDVLHVDKKAKNDENASKVVKKKSKHSSSRVNDLIRKPAARKLSLDEIEDTPIATSKYKSYKPNATVNSNRKVPLNQSKTVNKKATGRGSSKRALDIASPGDMFDEDEKMFAGKM